MKIVYCTSIDHDAAWVRETSKSIKNMLVMPYVIKFDKLVISLKKENDKKAG